MRCAGALLTGGASTRMGRDKATLALDGTTLSSRTATLLLAVADPVVELGPGSSGLPAVADPGAGPLAALTSARAVWDDLPHAGHVVVLATDLPRLTAGLVGWLALHPAAGAVVPVDRGRQQPLCARYPVAALRALAADPPPSARLLDWVAALHPLLVGPAGWAGPAGDPLALRDVDTPDDLAVVVGRSRP